MVHRFLVVTVVVLSVVLVETVEELVVVDGFVLLLGLAVGAVDVMRIVLMLRTVIVVLVSMLDIVIFQTGIPLGKST